MAESASLQPNKSSKRIDRQSQPQQVSSVAAGSLFGVLQRAQSAPASLRPADVLQLQRTIGNRATGRLLQTKLKLGPAGDQYEQEADRVAKQVVRASRQPAAQREEGEDGAIQTSRYASSMADYQRNATPVAAGISRVQRGFFTRPQTPKVQRDEIEDELQAAPNHGLEGGDVDADVARSIESSKGSGQPLHDSVRSSMERGFGADFSGVNVHTGPKADALNRSLNARAFTTGSDIFFGKGQYNPGSTGGQELIAHELTHTVQQGAAGVRRQSMNGFFVQRTLNQTQLDRLKLQLGQGKFAKVIAAKQEEFFHKLADDKLQRFKTMRNDHFDELVKGLSGGMIAKLLAKPGELGQVADLLGAAVETGEDAAQVAAMLPSLLGGMGSLLSAGSDVAMEGMGGGIGGIKDTYEGGSSIVKQQKYVEGGLTTLGGLSGLASLIPGVPDVIGVAGAGAKSAAGVAKIANTKINRNAITRLRADAAANPAVLAALEILDGKLGYFEGVLQTGLGAFEGAGALAGGVGKYATSAISKGIETLPGWLGWAGRGIASTVTSRVDSNETVRKNDELEKSEMKAAMREAVETVKGTGLPEHIGRLHRLATLIDPDLAEAMDDAVASLHMAQRTPVLAAIKLKATWNPS